MAAEYPPAAAAVASARGRRASWSAQLVVLPGFVAVGLMLLWAEHDGGYDADTWYWGALLTLALLVVTVIGLGSRRAALSRPAALAMLALAAYTAWSYLSILWADVPGWALEGSNRTLLYLLLFALFAVIPWAPGAGLAAMALFALGVGTLAVWILARMAFGHDIAALLIDGRLVAPTGYFNSSVALFMMAALVATTLATRRELPVLLRGALLAVACAALQLCVTGQSRGWLFTLPLVLLASIAVVRDRVRVTLAAVLPAAGALIPLHRLLTVFEIHQGPALQDAAGRAARISLLICAGVLVAGALLAWADVRLGPRRMRPAAQRVLGAAVAAAAIGAASAGVLAATHGHPVAFVQRQWHGFSHESDTATASHFAAVGSSRYDLWRVSLDAFLAHPVGGLGQDNFADYYITRRRTGEDPRSTHSLEMRLLAETGAVGTALFAAFTILAVAAALRSRRVGSDLAAAVGAAALLPLIVWAVHGSVDWFWEMPALSGPAFACLGLGAALGRPRRATSLAVESLPDAHGPHASAATAGAPEPATPLPRGAPPASRRAHSAAARGARALGVAAGAVAVLAAAGVLGFPYLAVREVSVANDVRSRDPADALSRLQTAAKLNPLSSDPDEIGGTIALETGRYADAERLFEQALRRRPHGWFAWLGAGLAASAQHHPARAEHDFAYAASLNSREPLLPTVLMRARTRDPVSVREALDFLARE